jgi:UPF0716 family protein affecting phage T7 exclusion
VFESEDPVAGDRTQTLGLRLVLAPPRRTIVVEFDGSASESDRNGQAGSLSGPAGPPVMSTLVDSRSMALPVDYWNEVEPSVMIIVGAVLFVIPEPITSTLGAGLMLLGGSWLFYEWREPSDAAAEQDDAATETADTTPDRPGT